jgi:hypothetical protein
MMHAHRSILLAVMLALVMLRPDALIGAQDAEATEEAADIPYYTAPQVSRRFNVPIPPGWDNLSTVDYAHFASDAAGGDIYVIALDAADMAAGIDAALSRLLPDAALDLRLEGDVALDDGPWLQRVYTVDDGGRVTAYAHVRDDAVYVLLYVDDAADGDQFTWIVQIDDEDNFEAGLRAGLAQIDPTLDADQADARADGDWTRLEFPQRDLSALAQTQGTRTYLVVGEGDDSPLDTGADFLNLLLGFFITPMTDAYLALGLAAVFVIVLALVGSMAARYRNMQKDAELIQQLH